MSKVLLVGDVHLRDNPPVNCTPEFLDDLWHSLNVISIMSADYDATVFAGDLFDFKQPSKTSHALMLKAIELFSTIDNAYVIAGNHDLSADRIDSLHAKQPLGVLIASGAVQYLDGWMDTIHGFEGDMSLPVYGLSWQQDWMNDSVRTFALEQYRHEQVMSKWQHTLLVTHAPIFPQGSEPPYEFIDLDVLAEDMGNTGNVFYGHIHDDHGIFTNSDSTVKFANHGSLNRARLTHSDLTRTVKVTSWDSSTGMFTPIEIEDQLPAARIFRLDAANATKAEARTLDEFLTAVGRSTLDISTTHGITEHIRTMDVAENVKFKSIALIEEQDA